MQIYNLIMVYSPDKQQVLMCKRLKNPYLGKINFPGGKAESGETSLDAAYRELLEETGITREDIKLSRVIDYTFYGDHHCKVEVYAGRLKHDVEVHGDENTLFWSTLDCDFNDIEIYAGEGSIAHMICLVNRYDELVLK